MVYSVKIANKSVNKNRKRKNVEDKALKSQLAVKKAQREKLKAQRKQQGKKQSGRHGGDDDDEEQVRQIC